MTRSNTPPSKAEPWTKLISEFIFDGDRARTPGLAGNRRILLSRLSSGCPIASRDAVRRFPGCCAFLKMRSPLVELEQNCVVRSGSRRPTAGGSEFGAVRIAIRNRSPAGRRFCASAFPRLAGSQSPAASPDSLRRARSENYGSIPRRSRILCSSSRVFAASIRKRLILPVCCTTSAVWD